MSLFVIFVSCSKLDYETIDSIGYRFKVIATDQGQPPRSSTAYVRVSVQNTNDEAPRFESTRLERIEATKTVNSVVTTVLASDPDGDKVSYQIVSSKFTHKYCLKDIYSVKSSVIICCYLISDDRARSLHVMYVLRSSLSKILCSCSGFSSGKRLMLC